MLEGEYGMNDICLGAPVILGKDGIEKIVEIELDETEMKHMKESAEGVRNVNDLLTF